MNGGIKNNRMRVQNFRDEVQNIFALNVGEEIKFSAVVNAVCPNDFSDKFPRNIFVRVIRQINSQKFTRVDKVIAHTVRKIFLYGRDNLLRNILHRTPSRNLTLS